MPTAIPPGRPSKFDAARLQAILKGIESGQTRLEAARSAGVSRSTFGEWLARGRAGEIAFVGFAEAIRLAESLEVARSNARFFSKQVMKLQIRERWRGIPDSGFTSCNSHQTNIEEAVPQPSSPTPSRFEASGDPGPAGSREPCCAVLSGNEATR